MIKECRDCKAERERRGEPVPTASKLRKVVDRSGGRCATHWRARKKIIKANTHETRVRKVYGLGPGDYARLYAFQGQVCAICRRATGATRKLAVDHDHATGLVRMLACGPCNKILGHFRDNPGLLRAAADALENPPAKQLGLVAYHEENRSA